MQEGKTPGVWQSLVFVYCCKIFSFNTVHCGLYGVLLGLHTFYRVSEASLTQKNLWNVLDVMSDGLWDVFGSYINTPKSELERITKRCSSVKECKHALISSFVSSHPAPSWTLVAQALYWTGWLKDNDSCLRALDLLHQLPTGMKKMCM